MVQLAKKCKSKTWDSVKASAYFISAVKHSGLMNLLVSRSQEYRKVNSIFGEGVNPLMRKIREALSMLGLPAEVLLKHGNKRVVYGVGLARNFRAVLLGLSATPQYIIPQTKPQEPTILLTIGESDGC